MKRKTSTERYQNFLKYRFKQPEAGFETSNILVAGDLTVENVVEYGDNDPNWKAKLKNGDGVVTTMQGEKYSVSGFQGFHGQHVVLDIFTGIRSIRSFEGDVQVLADLPVDPGTFNADDADNAAKQIFVKRALKAQRALQGLVSIGELRETIELIKHPLRTLRSYADDLYRRALKRKRKMRGSSRKKLKDAMADTWLEWSFGAAPLISDVESGAKAAARTLTFHPPQQFIKADASRRSSSTDSKRLITTGIGLQCEYSVRNYVQTDVRYYGSVWTVVPGSSLWANQFGITPWDVIPAAWELIPFSFLVDYFLNVQEIVDAACFPTTSIRWLGRGELKQGVSAVTSVVPKFVGSINPNREVVVESSLAASEGCEVRRQSIRRTPFGDSLIPSVEWEIPGMKSKKWLNVAALAASGRIINGTNRI